MTNRTSSMTGIESQTKRKLTAMTETDVQRAFSAVADTCAKALEKIHSLLGPNRDRIEVENTYEGETELITEIGELMLEVLHSIKLTTATVITVEAATQTEEEEEAKPAEWRKQRPGDCTGSVAMEMNSRQLDVREELSVLRCRMDRAEGWLQQGAWMQRARETYMASTAVKAKTEPSPRGLVGVVRGDKTLAPGTDNTAAKVKVEPAEGSAAWETAADNKGEGRSEGTDPP